MAKGQKRKTREAKKPRQTKAKPPAAEASAFTALHGNRPLPTPLKK